MNTRTQAAEVLLRVTQQGISLTQALEQILPSIPREVDRAFVQALSYGVLRQYERLEFWLSRLATRPIRDDSIRMLLLLGLYQLEFTRVKPHAAVSETVAAAGTRAAWAKPLLNGVLRNFQRQRDNLLQQAEAVPSAHFAHPGWIIQRLRADWAEQADALLQEAQLAPPMSLRVNPLRISRADYLEMLRSAGIEARLTEFAHQGLVLLQPVSMDRLPGFTQGMVSVQDEAAQLAAGLLDLQPGQLVLDLCAAPGGKTLAMLESCPNLAQMLAVDISAERLQRVRDNLDRAGLDAQLREGDATDPASWWDGIAFDRILLDVPCSALGVIRRHPDIKLLRRPTDIAALQEQQARILKTAWGMLKPGGRMLYVTCSVLQQENEQSLDQFLQLHEDAREIRIEADWGLERLVGRQILTGQQGMDGFYYGLVEKSAP